MQCIFLLSHPEKVPEDFLEEVVSGLNFEQCRQKEACAKLQRYERMLHSRNSVARAEYMRGSL